ncbi:MAG: glycosyltransferase [Lachnospiraceae bacterium]|nr:glycosyltransferase [Lachnospiraceae bacterium]
MAIKEKIRGVLVGRQDRQYAKKLTELAVTHDEWEKKREAGESLEGSNAVRYFGADEALSDGTEDNPDGVQPGIFCVRYSDIEKFIESGELLKCDDAEIVVFARKEGRLSSGAPSLISTWFTEHPTGKLMYGDEDLIAPDGTYEEPYFKPSWSPETYCSCFYVGSLFAVRGSVLKNTLLHPQHEQLSEEQKKMRGKILGGLADALFMKLAVSVGGFRRRRGIEFPIGHVSEILFHLEKGQDLFMGRMYPTSAVNGMDNFFMPVGGMPQGTEAGDMVTVIIPTKDHPGILSECLDSIIKTCDDAVSYEILVVDNGSTGYNKLLIANDIAVRKRENGLKDIRYLHKPMEFNFSRMCNLGAKRARGNILLFLNDDITAVTPGWMVQMALLAKRTNVGAVGAKLLYPDSDEGENERRSADPRAQGVIPAHAIQHAGVTNVRLGPVHKLQYMSDDKAHYFGFNRGIRDLIGVTGACLMIEKSKYYETGGLPEDMAVAFNDVDLCYKLFENGYYNVAVNSVRLLHHESLSRGLDTLDAAKMERLAGEHMTLMGRHQELYNYDPFYSPHLVEDEHISDISAVYEVMQPDELIYANLSHHAEGLTGAAEDKVLRVGVEYADTLEYWMTGKRQDGDSGYYIKGYSFVIGADNACYDRRLVLRQLVERDTADGTGKAYVPEKSVYSMPADDWYRPDIKAKLEGQINVDLTGYRVRLMRGSVPPGIYQIGMLAIDRTSRQRLVNWVENRIRID